MHVFMLIDLIHVFVVAYSGMMFACVCVDVYVCLCLCICAGEEGRVDEAQKLMEEAEALKKVGCG